MKITPYDKSKLTMTRVKNDNFKLLSDFVNSGHDCVEVKEFTQTDAASCKSSLSASARRFGFNVIVMNQHGRIFLIKK